MSIPSEDIAIYPPPDGRGLSLIADPELRRLAKYWASKRNGRPVPSRADIDPIDIPWALPHFFLIDYDRDTGTYRYRIAGGDVETIFQSATGSHSMRGVALRDMLKPDAAALVEKRWQPLADRGDIVYMSGMVYLPAERIPKGERVLLPLSDRDDFQTTGLIGMTKCTWLPFSGTAPEVSLNVHYIPLGEIP
jgi:hypothetical protein